MIRCSYQFAADAVSILTTTVEDVTGVRVAYLVIVLVSRYEDGTAYLVGEDSEFVDWSLGDAGVVAREFRDLLVEMRGVRS